MATGTPIVERLNRSSANQAVASERCRLILRKRRRLMVAESRRQHQG